MFKKIGAFILKINKQSPKLSNTLQNMLEVNLIMNKHLVTLLKQNDLNISYAPES